MVRIELAAFFAQVDKESDGGFFLMSREAHFWAYCYLEGFQQKTGYSFCKEDACDWLGFECPCAPGRKYYGRGPMMLEWNYNYAEFSLHYFGNFFVLDHPDILKIDPVVGFAVLINF